jgi:hypothetical protein
MVSLSSEADRVLTATVHRSLSLSSLVHLAWSPWWARSRHQLLASFTIHGLVLVDKRWKLVDKRPQCGRALRSQRTRGPLRPLHRRIAKAAHVRSYEDALLLCSCRPVVHAAASARAPAETHLVLRAGCRVLGNQMVLLVVDDGIRTRSAQGHCERYW